LDKALVFIQDSDGSFGNVLTRFITRIETGNLVDCSSGTYKCAAPEPVIPSGGTKRFSPCSFNYMDLNENYVYGFKVLFHIFSVSDINSIYQ